MSRVTGADPTSGLVQASDTSAVPCPRDLVVFVHLARDKDPDHWLRAHQNGTLVGVNDATPYGYGRAEHMGCRVTFSRSAPENPLSRLMRLAIRAVSGFDYIHALRQREALARADVVWTHTESQFLAVVAVLGRSVHRPKVLGQSVWLFDRWPSLTRLHRALYRHLIARVDVLTFHSTENLSMARSLFPEKHVALVLFGISSEQATAPVLRPANPIRIVAPGNDRDRDWRCLIEALGGRPGVEVLILSHSIDRRLVGRHPNIRVVPVKTNDEYRAALAAATLVCVPLRPNLHASGVTVIQEAVLAGVPVVASDAGGLTSYFAPGEISYVRPGNPPELRDRVLAIGSDPTAARAMASRAQARMIDGRIGAESFVKRHVDLSREIMGT